MKDSQRCYNPFLHTGVSDPFTSSCLFYLVKIMKQNQYTIKALIFDFDGLILETEEPIFLSWQKLYASLGLELPLDMWLTTVGSSDADWDPVQDLNNKMTGDIELSLLEQRLEYEMEIILAQPVLPGVVNYLESARRLGLKTAVASSSSREWVEGHLRRTGLISYFDCLRTSDDVTFTKPDPELFVTAMQALEVEPQQSLVLEDSANGILAAKRAGAWCVAVPNKITRSSSLDLADLRLDSLADMPLDLLLSKFPSVK
jgi:HAD superfamily hydrolase (TIGR01509 family)